MNTQLNDRGVRVLDPNRYWPIGFWNEMFPDAINTSIGEIEMYEDDNVVVVKMKAAGFNSEDIEISIEGKILTITGKFEKEEVEDDTKRKYYYREIKNESFSRSISLPTTVKSDKVEAEFKNGILKIIMPKVEEVKPKKISINVK
jgi:HSP20 family protein